jgi:branched-chain amino acid transport system ATP-binding protein
MLTCDGLGIAFGGVVALSNVTFSVGPGVVLGVIGPNGSGKSTMVNLITGFYRPTTGSVRLDDIELTHKSPEVVRRMGVARTFQNLRLAMEMTALDNALAGLNLYFAGQGTGVLRMAEATIGMPAAHRRALSARELALEALSSVEMKHRANVKVGSMSYGEQKRLELARAMALRPRVLFLDEPTAGLAPREAEELMELMAGLARGSEDMTLVLIEHRLQLVLDVSDRVLVLDCGRLIADDTSENIAKNADVRRIYVGGD